jgi:outer membrane protein assembly factor BamB
MKRPVSVLICVLVLIGMLFAPCSALVTTAAPPLKADDAQLLWKYVPGTDYLDAPSVPVYFEDKVYVMHHKSIDCLNASTGNVEKTGVMTASPSYAIVPVLCTDDMVYCPLGDGTVQAFARDTLISRWVYTDPLGGQALTDIVTDGTHVFTGFWNDEAEDAAFVCLDAATGTCLWRVTRRGGFYFAPCLVVGDTVLLGGDNGTGGDGDGQLLCLDKATGETLDALTFSGDNRSAIVAYADACYFTTKAGKLYKVRLQDGKLTLDKTVDLPGASTAAPIGYGGKLYLGVQKGSAGAVLTLDADTLQTLQTVPVAGYPQAEMLLVDGASPRLILTCNTPPGALYTLDPAAGSVEVLYTPEKGSRNYCISSVQVMPDGTLLYKNDSGAVFAVGKKQKEASEAQGYAAGGFTPAGPKYREAGIVHAGEWVASQELVKSPVTRPVIDVLEAAQRNNTIPSPRRFESAMSSRSATIAYDDSRIIEMQAAKPTRTVVRSPAACPPRSRFTPMQIPATSVSATREPISVQSGDRGIKSCNAGNCISDSSILVHLITGINVSLKISQTEAV